MPCVCFDTPAKLLLFVRGTIAALAQTMKNAPWHRSAEQILALLVERSIGRNAPMAWTVIRRLEAAIAAGKV